MNKIKHLCYWYLKHFCYWYLNPYWWVKPYFLSFVEEGIFDPKYKDFIGGRAELFTQWSEYDINEYRFFTKKRKEFYKFRERWDLKNLTYFQIRKLKKIIEEEYNETL
jgi:hypothetical protein